MSEKTFLKEFKKNNFECYIVGGAVRSKLLNKPVADVDFATSATPAEVMSIFNKTIPTGLQHGTVSVIWGNDIYEVTTFRVDGKYSDNRHPDGVKFVRNLKEDLKRRDFTINAMAIDENDQIIDLFNGLSDIKNKLIKCVGNAEDRFEEDALRILRGLRFAAQLDFDIEEKTYFAMQKKAYLLENIAIERIMKELSKIFIATNSKKYIEIMVKIGIFNHINFFKNKEIKLADTWLDFLAINSNNDLKLLKLSKNEEKEIEKILFILNKDIHLYEKLFQFGPNFIFDKSYLFELFDLEKLSLNEYVKIYNGLPINKENKKLPIEPLDLINFTNKKPGKWISEYLKEIHELVLHSKLKPNKKEILNYVLEKESV